MERAPASPFEFRAGAATWGLLLHTGRVVGVAPSRDLLGAFAERAERYRVDHTEVTS